MPAQRVAREFLRAGQFEIAAGKGFFCGDLEACANIVDRIHGACIVDVVGRKRRGVDCARRHGIDHLEKEIALMVRQHKNACRP